jgi:hypothetical protein
VLFAGGVIVAAAIASGYLTVAGLVAPGALGAGGDTTAARTFAAYVATRSLVLLATLLLAAARALGGLTWAPRDPASAGG